MQLKVKQRIALSTCFFLSGFCFSSWASRIPTIKTIFNFSEADLGNLLLVMPIASLIGLPISGWMVSKFSSRNPLVLSMLFFAASYLLWGIPPILWPWSLPWRCFHFVCGSSIYL